MASEEIYARGAGTSEQVLTGGELNGIDELSEEEIKEIAREQGASWQMPPSGLYVLTIFKISKKIEAETKDGKKYTYRQVLGNARGRSGNLTYNGEVLLKVIGTQAEIFRKIANSESRKCLIDVRRWNGMLRIQGVYGLDYIIDLLNEDSPEAAKDVQEALENGK